MDIYRDKFRGMSFEEYFNHSLKQIDEEIEIDKHIIKEDCVLFESPMLHQSDYFQFLNNKLVNHEWSLKVKENGKFIENVTIHNKNYELYRTFEQAYTWDLFISGDAPYEQISCFVKYKPKNEIMQIGGLWQIDWVLGLVRGLITEYYPKHFSVLESSPVMNNKGKNFYQSLVKEFLKNNKKVTVVSNGKEIPYELKDAGSYWEYSDSVASIDKCFKFYF